MSLIKSKQLDLLLGTVRKATSAATIAAGSSIVVTTALVGKVAGGSNTVAGVVTTAPANLVGLSLVSNGSPVTDDLGNQIVGRLTEAGGIWTVDYFVTDGAGGESAFTFAAESAVGEVFSFSYVEVVQVKDINPLDAANGIDNIDETDFNANAHQRQVDKFVATAAQTAFTLTQTPKDDAAVTVTVNGQDMTDRLVVVATAATYAATDYALEVGDVVQFSYDR